MVPPEVFLNVMFYKGYGKDVPVLLDQRIEERLDGHVIPYSDPL